MKYFLLLSLLFLSSCFSTYYYTGDGSLASYSGHLRKAQEAVNQKKYTIAISHYKDHIQTRLDAENRSEWENPYFYYLIIGDLRLKQDQPEKAIESILVAQANAVDTGLISDRFRLVANYYEQKEEFDKAIEILQTYRESDPLLFDLMRDRILRRVVALEEKSLREQQNKSESTPLPSLPASDKMPEVPSM